MWGTQTDNAMNGTLFAGNDSKLAAYGQQCNNFCAQTSIMTYQNYNYSLWWAAYIQNYGWYAQAVNADQNNSLVQGSSMSLSPIWTNDTSTVVLYANTGNLTRFRWNQLTAWEKSWSYNRKLAFLLQLMRASLTNEAQLHLREKSPRTPKSPAFHWVTPETTTR